MLETYFTLSVTYCQTKIDNLVIVDSAQYAVLWIAT